MIQRLLGVAAAMSLATSVANAVEIQLQPIGDAFARLGVSCGGIAQQIFGENFTGEGNVTGHVFATTTCGGSGRGGGYHDTKYSTWVAVSWNLSGAAIDEVTSVPNPDPSIAGTFHSGGLVGGANYPTCNNENPYDNSFSCFSIPVLDAARKYSVQTRLTVVDQAACSASNTTYCTYRAFLTSPAAVPETNMLALLLTGLGTIGVVVRIRRTKQVVAAHGAPSLQAEAGPE